MWRRALRWANRIGYGALAGAFGLAYFVEFLPEAWFWWVEFPAVFLPYLALLLFGVSFVVWKRGSNPLRLFHAVLLVLALVRFLPGGWCQAPAADDLTVLTYNAPSRGKTKEEAARVLVQLARQVEPELFALQEAYAWRARNNQIRATAHVQLAVDTLDYQPPQIRQEGWTYYGPAVLSRVEILDQTAFPMTDHEGNRKKFLRTHFRWQGREAVHYNLHLQSHGDQKPWAEAKRSWLNPRTWISFLRMYRHNFFVRNAQARAIRAHMAQETLPLIISGDFNATPHNRAFRIIARGMQDGYRKAGPGWGATYHARLPLFRIDHVLVSPEWQVVAAEVPHAELSDHRPVAVWLRWKE